MRFVVRTIAAFLLLVVVLYGLSVPAFLSGYPVISPIGREIARVLNTPFVSMSHEGKWVTQPYWTLWCNAFDRCRVQSNGGEISYAVKRY